MGFLARSLSPRLAATAATGSDWTYLTNEALWSSPGLGLGPGASLYVGPETIYRCCAVLAGLRFLSNSVAMCPIHTMRMEGKRRIEAPEHYVQRLFDGKPWPRYTEYRWVRQQVTWAASWGNAYNRIIRGPGAPITALEPLYPGYISEYDFAADGSLIYEYRDPRKMGSKPEYLKQNLDILHFSGISADGVSGVKIYQMMRNAVEIALAAEGHSRTYLRKGTRPGGILTTTAKIEPTLRDSIKKSWEDAFGGVANSGGTAVLGSGYTWTPVTVDHQKSQFMELQAFELETLLMFLGIPGTVIGYAGSKANTYASVKAYLEDSVNATGQWVRNLECEMQSALFYADDPHYIKLNMGGLLRPNIETQIKLAVLASGGPISSVNEQRAWLDWNPSDDEAMDEIRSPLNYSQGAAAGSEGKDTEDATGGGEEGYAAPPPKAPPATEDKEARAKLDRIVAHAGLASELVASQARSLVASEVAAIAGRKGGPRAELGAAGRFASDQQGLAAWLTTFYAAHAVKVRDRLPSISEEAARAYCADQRGAVLARGVAVVETWEATKPQELAAMALGG